MLNCNDSTLEIMVKKVIKQPSKYMIECATLYSGLFYYASVICDC